MRGHYGRRVYWRATMQPARMLLWDARAAPTVGLFVIHARLHTLLILIAVLALCSWCDYRGISLPSALRAVRSALAGRVRRAVSRPARSPACFAAECGTGIWDPAYLAVRPPPRWQRAAERGWRRLEESAGKGRTGRRLRRSGAGAP